MPSGSLNIGPCTATAGSSFTDRLTFLCPPLPKKILQLLIILCNVMYMLFQTINNTITIDKSNSDDYNIISCERTTEEFGSASSALLWFSPALQTEAKVSCCCCCW